MIRQPKTHFFPEERDTARILALGFLLLFPLCYGLFALYLGQDANWDLRNYHWYNAYAFLNNRYNIDILPSQLPFFYNPLLDVPFYLLGSHLPAKLASFILTSVQGVNSILLFMLSYATIQVKRPVLKVGICSGIALLGVLGAGAISQIGATFYDNITSLGIFISILLVFYNTRRFLGGAFSRNWLPAMLTGIPAGLAMGLKLPAVIFCLGLCLAFLTVGGSASRRVWLAFFFGIGVLVGLGVTYGFWGIHLYTQYHNPVFPYFTSLFPSNFAPPVTYHDTTFVPGTWYERIMFPILFTENPYRVGEIAWRDLRIPVLYFIAPVCLVLWSITKASKTNFYDISRCYQQGYILSFGCISYFVWMFVFSIYRYLLALEMIAPLLIVLAIGLLPWPRRFQVITTLCIVLILVGSIQPGNWRRLDIWSDRVVSIKGKLPAISDNSMILMAGFQPYSHVISEFPPQIPFIRIESNFSKPTTEASITAIIREKITHHKGTFYLLIPEPDMALAESALKAFDLKVHPETCKNIRDTLSDFDLKLCDLVK